MPRLTEPEKQELRAALYAQRNEHEKRVERMERKFGDRVDSTVVELFEHRISLLDSVLEKLRL